MQDGQHFGQPGNPQRGSQDDAMSGLGFSSQTGQGGSEAEQKVDELRRSAAQTLDRGADRVEDWADEHEGALGNAARRTAGMMERGAEAAQRYDADDVRQMIERQVRSSPLPSLLMAVAAGWLVGRILR
jgi:hypothetical protein